jgi:hypothetical protein
MKTIAVIFSLFFVLTSFSQGADTLNSAKGKWKFKHMCIAGDTSLQSNYFHATDLIIDSKEFEIGLSEAYAKGMFTIENSGIIGTYSAGDRVFDTLRIQKIKRKRLTVQLTTSTPEYWGGKAGQNIIVYLTYKRRN